MASFQAEGACRLEVHCQETQPGDEVCCVGEPAAVGAWNADRAVALETGPETFPKWCTPAFPLLSPGDEFKLVIRRRGGGVSWESFQGNRSWPSCLGRGGYVAARFGDPAALEVLVPGEVADEQPPRRKLPSFRRLSCGRIVAQELPPVEPAVSSTALAAAPLPLPRPPAQAHAQGHAAPEDKDVADILNHSPHRVPAAEAVSFGRASTADTLATAAVPSPGSSAEAGSGLAARAAQAAEQVPSHVSCIFGNRGFVQDFYETDGKQLGAGNSGSVRVAMAKRTQQRRAIKTIHRLRVEDMRRFKAEIDIMKMMDHPNVIKLYEHFEDTKNFYLVMELCTGGDLFDHIIMSRDFSEVHAAHVMYQLLQGLNYIHHRQVAHRDIKPENFLLATKRPIERNTLKIIDFGLSHVCTSGQVLTTRLGTPTYVAPEVLRGAYGRDADVWSLGVVLFVLLSGKPPFEGETDQQVFRAIKRGVLSFGGVTWQKVSAEAKDFIRKMVCLRACDRISAADALANDWLRSTLAAAAEPTEKTAGLGAELLDNLRSYKAQNLLKKATLQIIAWRFLDDERIRTMQEAFKLLDRNDDGVLSFAEIRAGLEISGVEDMPRDLHQIVDSLDTEGNGTVNYTAFAAATMARRTAVLDDVLKAAFTVFDKNGDGMISEDELRDVLHPGNTARYSGSCHEHAERIADVIRQADQNGDGHIDFQEFVYMMRCDDMVPECSASSTELEPCSQALECRADTLSSVR